MIKDGDRRILSYLRYFDFLDNMDRNQLLTRQLERLRSILIHAYENTEYYKSLFDEIGFTPAKLQDVDDLRRIPLLTKDVIRNKLNRLTAKNIDAGALDKAATGGSTGTPMSFLRDRQSHYLRKGQELYFDRWMGYEIGQRTALFVATAHFDGPADRLKARIRNATCERLLRFDPHNITDKYMEQFAKRFQAYRPEMIKCFPNALSIFAEFLNRNKIDLPPVRVVSCTGENLYTQQRRLFAKTFEAEVYDKYGTFECGVIASECRLHHGLHVFTEGAYLELLDDRGMPIKPGQMGKIVITDLFNKGMPFIRYEIGDMGIAAQIDRCKCGSNLPLIQKVLGRDRDIIIDSNGNPKPGYLFVHAISNLDLPAQLQVIQVSRDRLKVKVAKKKTSHLNLARLRDKFQDIVGPKIIIEFEHVMDIPRDPSGKFRYVVSELKKSARRTPS